MLDDYITLFEGKVYSVGTGTSAVTIPSHLMKIHNIQNGDILRIIVDKLTKAHTLYNHEEKLEKESSHKTLSEKDKTNSDTFSKIKKKFHIS